MKCRPIEEAREKRVSYLKLGTQIKIFSKSKPSESMKLLTPPLKKNLDSIPLLSAGISCLKIVIKNY